MQQKDNIEALSQQNLMNTLDEIDTNLKYMCVSKAGMAIGSTSAEKVKFANTITYVHNGIVLQKTTAEVAFTATTHDITADADAVQEAMYMLCLDADGNATLHMGDVADGAGNAVLPERPSGKTPVGAVRVAVAAGSTDFNASTDDLSAAHITDTYYDLGYVGARFDAEV